MPERKEQLSLLKDGDLYYTGTIEGMINLSQGDTFYDSMYGAEIILKDGVIHEIKKTDVPVFAPVK